MQPENDNYNGQSPRARSDAAFVVRPLFHGQLADTWSNIWWASMVPRVGNKQTRKLGASWWHDVVAIAAIHGLYTGRV